MDTLFDDDDALQSLVNDGDFNFFDRDELLRARSDSDLSIATTISAQSPVPTGSLVVEAFCTFNAAVVHIDYDTWKVTVSVSGLSDRGVMKRTPPPVIFTASDGSGRKSSAARKKACGTNSCHSFCKELMRIVFFFIASGAIFEASAGII